MGRAWAMAAYDYDMTCGHDYENEIMTMRCTMTMTTQLCMDHLSLSLLTLTQTKPCWAGLHSALHCIM